MGTGALIVGGAVAAVGTLLPWFDLADGTTVAGVESMAGIGTLVLAVTAVAIGVFILLRPDHPAARPAAWGGLVAVMGIAALGVIAALTTGRERGHDDRRRAPDLVRRRHGRHDGLPRLLTRTDAAAGAASGTTGS